MARPRLIPAVLGLGSAAGVAGRQKGDRGTFTHDVQTKHSAEDVRLCRSLPQVSDDGSQGTPGTARARTQSAGTRAHLSLRFPERKMDSCRDDRYGGEGAGQASLLVADARLQGTPRAWN